MAVAQPVGTVTMVFTDIEGSTRLLEELGLVAYRDALARHRDVIRKACARHHGYEVDYEGDAFFYAFGSAQHAVAAVGEAMTGLDGGPIRVRVGIHTGEPGLDPPKYVGLDVHRAARIMASAHGGQVVLSPSTVALLEPGAAELRDLGEHRLKDLTAPIRLHQLLLGGLPSDFPPLKTLYRSNLPVPATPFLGRETELQAVVERLTHPDTRLLTLTGPGGTGKTRLALQAAAAAADHYPDGITWIPLAPLRDPALVIAAISQAVGLREQPGQMLADALAQALSGKAALLILDNVEHLLPDAAHEISFLAAACPSLRLFVTSRERMRLAVERSWPVPQMSATDGERLFVERALAVGVELEVDEHVRELCRRLDELPLAIELAAARAGLFTPAQLMQRLGERLDLLEGAVDVDARQQTLRATIDWSYRLLTEEERRVLRALSVFAGGCTLEAAERVCGARSDTLQSLLDKSLLRRRVDERGGRFWLLETIRQYAAERLQEAGSTDAVLDALLEWLVAFSVEAERAVKGDPDQAAWFVRVAAELPNLRVGVDHALAGGDARALECVTRLGLWWDLCAVPEGRSLLEQAMQAGAASPFRARALVWSGLLALRMGDLAATRSLSQAGIDAAAAAGDTWTQAWGLTNLANIEWVSHDLAAAGQGYAQALAVARASLDPWLEQAIEANLATFVSRAEAEGAGARDIDQLAEAASARGDSFMRAFIDVNRGERALAAAEWDTANRYLADAEATFAAFGSWFWLVPATPRVGALIELGRTTEARQLALDTLHAAVNNLYLDPANAFQVLVATAAVLAALDRQEPAAILIGAAQTPGSPDPNLVAFFERVRREITEALPPLRLAQLQAQGREMSTSATLAFAIDALAE